MHDSFTPLGEGLVPLIGMQLGEVIFGGVGSGLYGMLVFVFVAIFIAGLMVGRTPEYLGKKIESRDVKLASLVVLVTAFGVLCPTAWASVSDWGQLGQQQRAARIGRDSVLFQLGYRQQRVRLRRIDDEHAVVQHTRRDHHPLWAVLHHCSGARPGRSPDREEVDCRRRRELSGHRCDVRGPAGQHGADRRRVDLLSGARPVARRRALSHALGNDDVLKQTLRPD